MKANKIRIYILGAGCSVKNGYPIAGNFIPELEAFGMQLGPGAKLVNVCVDETLRLMRRASVQTIDDLAARIHNGCFDDDPSRGSMRPSDYRNRQVDKAKVATAAMLLAKEKVAKQTGLRSYHDLLHDMFPITSSWERALAETNWHVLTFNYDRLFEMAFLDRIGIDLGQRFGLYSESLLNSGFKPGSSEISFAESRFSFLKLHGSVGAHVRYDMSEPEFFPLDQEGFASDQTCDQRFFPESPSVTHLPSSPLIIFPFEKQLIQAGRRDTDYEKYITAVWGRAKALIAEASEIWIVGYSFQAIDRPALITLLEGAKRCDRGIIQNVSGEAERICKMLEVKHPEIGISWKPYACEF